MMAQILNYLPSARNRLVAEKQWHPWLPIPNSGPPAAASGPSCASVGSI